MDIFYHAMNYTSKGIIDASCCGGFKRRSAEEARQVIEDLAKCNYKTPSESSGSSSRIRGNGLIGLDRTTAIEAKLDAVMNILSSNERRMLMSLKVIYFQSIFLIDFYIKRLIYMQESGINFTKLLCSRKCKRKQKLQ